MEYTSLAEKIIAHREGLMQTQLTETLPKTRCTSAMRLALETLAINQDCSMSDIVRTAVHNHLNANYRSTAGQGPAGTTPSSSETVEKAPVNVSLKPTARDAG